MYRENIHLSTNSAVRGLRNFRLIFIFQASETGCYLYIWQSTSLFVALNRGVNLVRIFLETGSTYFDETFTYSEKVVIKVSSPSGARIHTLEISGDR